MTGSNNLTMLLIKSSVAALVVHKKGVLNMNKFRRPDGTVDVVGGTARDTPFGVILVAVVGEVDGGERTRVAVT